MSLNRRSNEKLKSSLLLTMVRRGMKMKLFECAESHVTSRFWLVPLQRNNELSPNILHPLARGSRAKSSEITAALPIKAAAIQNTQATRIISVLRKDEGAPR